MAPSRIASSVPAIALALLFGLPPVHAQGNPLQEADRLLKAGQSAQALERVNTHLTQNPKDARGRFLKGVILTEQSKTKEAIQVFTELTQDFPELPEPYNNLAVLHAAQGNYDMARMALEMAVRARPGYATAHENLGDIYARMAGQSYDRAQQLDRSNTTARVKLNLVRELLSDGARTPAKPAQ
jgi:Flp pilus assembly protein TadD